MDTVQHEPTSRYWRTQRRRAGATSMSARDDASGDSESSAGASSDSGGGQGRGIIGLDGVQQGSTRQSDAQACELAEDAIQKLSELYPRAPEDAENARGIGDNRPDGVAPEDVVEFSRLILKRDTADAFAFMEQLRDRGASEEALYLDLLAPTARRLGDLWVADLCDFTEVTIGLGRLQHAMHELSFDFHRHALNMSQQRRILLLPAPGEQHTMGLLMVGEFFRRSGWDVWSAPWSSRDDMLAMVQHQWFPVVGLSISCDRHLDELTRGIQRIRKESRNESVGIMVGGPLVLDHPEVVARVGADATATDARDAAVQAEKLLESVIQGRPG
jgi:methanogenic corrinoid protein MtbC1